MCVVIIITLLCTACTTQDEPVYHDQFFAFGTLIDLTLYDVEPDTAARTSSELEELFKRMHSDWHAWHPGLLQQTNAQLATLDSFSADPAILPLILEANRLSTMSNGLFNPAIGKLVALWGFHSDDLPQGPPPDADAIRTLVAQAPAAADVSVTDNRLTNHNPAVQYDLGAFAKGYAIDRGIELLKKNGIKNAILNAGGDLRIIGRHGDRPWRIGIRHPRQPGVLAAIEVSGDESVFTSGDYERFYEMDGKRYHHIIDPRSGYPAGETTSVTVIHSDAATADAAATALFVAGPQLWHEIARRLGIHYVMLIDREGTVYMNPAMQSRVVFDIQPRKIELSEPLS